MHIYVYIWVLKHEGHFHIFCNMIYLFQYCAHTHLQLTSFKTMSRVFSSANVFGSSKEAKATLGWGPPLHLAGHQQHRLCIQTHLLLLNLHPAQRDESLRIRSMPLLKQMGSMLNLFSLACLPRLWLRSTLGLSSAI